MPLVRNGDNMQIHLEEELGQLKEMLFRMSDLSLEAIADAVESL